jgi:hypothetical protein
MPTDIGLPLKRASQSRWTRVAGEVSRMAVWGVCGALAVVALTMIQKAPDVRAAADSRHAAEIAAENRGYCEKWGMRAGTREHAACTFDLDELRARHDKRLAADAQGLL